MASKIDALVCGAGGFIGGWLVKRLLEEGAYVRAVDIKPVHLWWQLHEKAENWGQCDLKVKDACDFACSNVSRVYQLAADMGGIGFIELHKAACMLNVLINTHIAQACVEQKCDRVFYSSSACIYPADKQDRPRLTGLAESDAYPAMPEDGYGWEKLFSERMFRHFMEDCGLEARVARFHNIYGPQGSWRDGREKAPAAMCRKVATAKITRNPEVEVWGDGTRTRSFCWIEDCVEGIQRIMDSDVREPLNLGSDEAVTVNGLLDLVEEAAGYIVERRYDHSKPKGVHGRNSDNSLIQQCLGWAPRTPLRGGIQVTYQWIEKLVAKDLKKRGVA